jgi:hypothetical protein
LIGGRGAAARVERSGARSRSRIPVAAAPSGLAPCADRGGGAANTAYEDKIRAIRTLNLSLPEDRLIRIRIHGPDTIHDWPLLAQALAGRGVTLDEIAFAAAKGPGRARLAADALRAAPEVVRDPYLLAALERQAIGLDRENTIFRNYAELVRAYRGSDWAAPREGAVRSSRPAGGRARRLIAAATHRYATGAASAASHRVAEHSRQAR